jgi:hypothetical protein
MRTSCPRLPVWEDAKDRVCSKSLARPHRQSCSMFHWAESITRKGEMAGTLG